MAASNPKCPPASRALVLAFRQYQQSVQETETCDQYLRRSHGLHTTIEEEIFYPAFIEATGDRAIHHEAVVEHAGAKKLIAEIQDMSPVDDYFDAKVSVLSE